MIARIIQRVRQSDMPGGGLSIWAGDQDPPDGWVDISKTALGDEMISVWVTSGIHTLMPGHNLPWARRLAPREPINDN